MGEILDATNRAIKAASHLGSMDAGAVETIRALALKIDLQDEYFEALADDAAQNDRRPPAQDNVSIPTYLKYAESLGLTPAGRTKLADAPKGKGDGGGKLGKLQSVPKPKSA